MFHRGRRLGERFWLYRQRLHYHKWGKAGADMEEENVLTGSFITILHIEVRKLTIYR